jgi:hypothetical protein
MVMTNLATANGVLKVEAAAILSPWLSLIDQGNSFSLTHIESGVAIVLIKGTVEQIKLAFDERFLVEETWKAKTLDALDVSNLLNEYRIPIKATLTINNCYPFCLSIWRLHIAATPFGWCLLWDTGDDLFYTIPWAL